MRKRFILILCLLAVSAFVIRMAVCVELLSSNNGMNWVRFPDPATDMNTYKQLSDMIARGEYKGELYYQPFYYAAFLPVIKVLFGNSVWTVLIWQSLLGALTVYLTGLCAAKVWGKNSGVVSAALLTFCGTLVLYTPFYLIVTLQAFWMILIFYTAELAIRHRDWKRWGLVGVICGCSILTRGNIWLLVPGLALAAVFNQFARKDDRRHLTPAKIAVKLIPMLVFLIATILPQLPFAAYNTKVLGKPSPPSTAAQNVLALGNTPEAPPGGREAGYGPGAMEYPPTYQLWTSDKNVPVQQKIWEWFKDEPAAFLELTWRKLLLFWDYREAPNNIDFEYHGEQSRTFEIFCQVQSWLLISLGLAGMLCLYRQNHKKLQLQVLSFMILAYWISISAFYILSRFRAPVMPLLAVYSGCFVCYFWQQRKKNFEQAYYFCFPAMFVFFCLTFFAYDFYRYHMEADVLRFVRPHGTKISINNHEDMVLDNGPMTFGGWNYVCFRPNVPVRKKFKGVDGKGYKSVTLSVRMIWETPGEATFLVNGRRFKVSEGKGGLMDQKFAIPFPENEFISIKLESANTRVFYYIDIQRNYGRTFIGDFQPPGELVCRAVFSRTPLKEVEAEQRRGNPDEVKDTGGHDARLATR